MSISADGGGIRHWVQIKIHPPGRALSKARFRVRPPLPVSQSRTGVFHEIPCFYARLSRKPATAWANASPCSKGAKWPAPDNSS